MAHFVEGDGKGVGRGGDERGGGRRDDPFAEDRTHPGLAAFEVVILDAGHEPAIRVVREGGQVGAAVKLPLLAGLGIRQGGDDGVVDRPVVADEPGIRAAELDLRLGPGASRRLGAQHVADGIADRQEATDDLGGLAADPLPAAAVLDRDRDGDAAHDLREASTLADQE